MDLINPRFVRKVPTHTTDILVGNLSTDTMNDSRPAAGAPSLSELQHALDYYIDNEDIFHFGLLPPSAAPQIPGDALDRAWIAYSQAARRFKREVLRSRDLEADLQDWEWRLEERSPHREAEEYQRIYLDACPTALDRRIAFAECMVNQRTIHAWRMYARCAADLENAVEVMKRHIGYLRHEEQELRIFEFRRRRALRVLRHFVKAHPRMCDDCRTETATHRFNHLDGRCFRLCGGCFGMADHEDDYLAHVKRPRLRIRAPPVGTMCDVCGAGASHTFKHKWGSDPMCSECYHAAMEELEAAAHHNAYRGCGCSDPDCTGDCGVLRCGCWEGECECYKSWGRD